MIFIGIDLHKKTISVCVMNQERKVLKRQTLHCAEPEKITAFFQKCGDFQAVVEATASYEWLWRLLEPLAQQRPGHRQTRLGFIALGVDPDCLANGALPCALAGGI